MKDCGTINYHLLGIDYKLEYNCIGRDDEILIPYNDTVNQLIELTNKILNQISDYYKFKIYIKNQIAKRLNFLPIDKIENFLLIQSEIKSLVLKYIKIIDSMHRLITELNEKIIDELDTAHYNTTGGSPRWYAGDGPESYFTLSLIGIDKFIDYLKPMLLRCIEEF
jgi:hypothetical protein